MTELQAASAWTPSWMRHHPLWKCILARDDHGHHLSPFKNPGGMHQIRLNMSASSSHYEVWALPRFSANFVVEIKTTLTKKTCDQPVNIHRSYICRKACPLWGIEENFMAKWFQCLAHCSIFLRRVLRLSPPSFEFPLPWHGLGCPLQGWLSPPDSVPQWILWASFRLFWKYCMSGAAMVCCVESVLPSALSLSSVRPLNISLLLEGVKLNILSMI